jgi:hypothetical protein
MNKMKYVYSEKTPLHEFIFFGCWNQTGCRDASDPQTKVANMLRKEPISIPIVLGGDNVYPDKNINGKKIYSIEKFMNGIKCLKPRQMYSALGNHNVAEPSIHAAHLHENLIRHDYYALVFSNMRALVFLDTNRMVDYRREEMLSWLSNVLVHFSKTGVEYYLVQHEPMVSHKGKKNQYLENGQQLLEVLEVHAPIMILAADTHNYQKGLIGWKSSQILQIVSGTGGASQDQVHGIHSPVKQYNYELLESEVSYGYQKINGARSEFVSKRISPRTRTRRSPKSPKISPSRKRRRRNDARTHLAY